MCSLQPLTYLQVQDQLRQWMVGPSSHSRPWPGETPTGAIFAVNGRASRWRKLSARTGQPLYLAAICHDARKSRYEGSRWSKLGAPPLHSTNARMG
jgi:hypothetical protein